VLNIYNIESSVSEDINEPPDIESDRPFIGQEITRVRRLEEYLAEDELTATHAVLSSLKLTE